MALGSRISARALVASSLCSGSESHFRQVAIFDAQARSALIWASASIASAAISAWVLQAPRSNRNPSRWRASASLASSRVTTRKWASDSAFRPACSHQSASDRCPSAVPGVFARLRSYSARTLAS